MIGRYTMTLLKHLYRISAAFLVLLGTTTVAKAQLAQPLVSEDTLTHVSEHVYALAGFPNIGIVVGNHGTLVIDTGLGERNGATVVRVAQKLAKGPNLYLTNTHYHSEHTSGEQAFPANTVILRLAMQQEEIINEWPRISTPSGICRHRTKTCSRMLSLEHR